MFNRKVDPILLERRKEVRSLLKGNWKDFWKGDFWPWVQSLSTVLFLVAIILIEVVNPLTIFLSLIWLGIQVFAMWMTYKNNRLEV